MGLPAAAEARLYYRAAKQRYEDAILLLDAGRTTGAVYLAGYTVECYLKALILAGVPAGNRRELLGQFHGSRAHSFEWLGNLYRQQVRTPMPADVNRHLLRVAAWSTDMRYLTGSLMKSDAADFILSVEAVALWADGRM
jgi:hypothetical protein